MRFQRLIRPDHLKEAEDKSRPDDPDDRQILQKELPKEELGADAQEEEDDGGSSEEDSDIYTVELILKKRIVRGQTQYFVKWDGYPHSDNTWEPEEHILDKSAIKIFEGRQDQKARRIP